MSAFKRIQSYFKTPRPAAALFSFIAVVSAGVTFALARSAALPQALPVPEPIVVEPVVEPSPPGAVVVRGRLSQTKLTQGQPGELYYDLSIEAPASDGPKRDGRLASDLIVVLDRSGSMGDDSRLSDAKAAIRELVAQLRAEDRFGLVSFDNSSRVDLRLSSVTPGVRSQVDSILRGIEPGGSTNLSDALIDAQTLAGESRSRATRIILLSDGEANAGVIDVRGLSEIAQRLARSGIVLSTIGLGNSYNEAVLSALADHGMGNYSYLESLAGLSKVLAKDLHDSRSLYAATSELKLKLGDGIRCVDAGGYPIELTQGALTIPTGQLLSGGKKNLFLTLSVPTRQLGTREVAKVSFSYNRNGVVASARVQGEPPRISVTDNVVEASASIKKDVFQRAWLSNNLGRMKAAVGNALAAGDAEGAKRELTEYRSKLKTAESYAGAPMADAANLAETAAVEQDLRAAAAMPAADNLKAIAKKQHAGSRTYQRQ